MVGAFRRFLVGSAGLWLKINHLVANFQPLTSVGGLQDGGRAVELGGEGLDGSGGDADLFLGLFPVALLQGLAHSRQGLDTVAGIEARGIDLVAEPRAARQARGAEERAL